MPCARPVGGAVVSSSCGTTSTARTPPYAERRSETWKPYAWQSRPTMAKPSRGDSVRSSKSLETMASRMARSARAVASSVRPRPPSSISIAIPLCTSEALRCTWVCGGE